MMIGMLLLTCAMAEMASAYPVAGAMATWTWVMARRGVGGERYWGWLIGGMVLGYHIATVSLTGFCQYRFPEAYAVLRSHACATY
jgi:amino acid transporter